MVLLVLPLFGDLKLHHHLGFPKFGRKHSRAHTRLQRCHQRLCAGGRPMVDGSMAKIYRWQLGWHDPHVKSR